MRQRENWNLYSAGNLAGMIFHDPRAAGLLLAGKVADMAQHRTEVWYAVQARIRVISTEGTIDTILITRAARGTLVDAIARHPWGKLRGRVFLSVVELRGAGGADPRSVLREAKAGGVVRSQGGGGGLAVGVVLDPGASDGTDAE